MFGAEVFPAAGSLSAFAEQLHAAYEKQDGKWMIQHSYTNGVPAEISTAQEQFFSNSWGAGELKVTSINTYRFGDYKPAAAPGTFGNKNLRFVIEPTHWIVLKAENGPAKKGEEDTIKIHTKMEFPVARVNNQWRIIGVTYAN
ncbi:hypothetical protein GC207_05880 [bacterium]|nr:hypothetical protein [bacterium]